MRFNDKDKTFSAEKGLTIKVLGELLTSLSKAINLNNDSLTLSEVKGNCYAICLSTPTPVVYETLKSVHESISKGDIENLNADQKKYANHLSVLLGGMYKMDVYDKNKTFDYEIQQTDDKRIVETYHEIDDVYGTISSIGGRSLSSQPCIRVSEQNYDISVTESQEMQLVKYFKKERIGLRIDKKIDFYTDKVISAELLEIEILKENESTFVSLANVTLKKRKKKSLFPAVNDSVNSVRKLRGNIETK